MGDAVDLRSGLATAVGPVPFSDPGEAVELALRGTPALPTVPSPGSGPTSLLAQAVDGFAALEALPSGMLRVRTGWIPGEPAADAVGLGPAFATFRHFMAQVPSHAGATSGFVGVRVALVGPVSLTLGLRAAGVPIDAAASFASRVVAARAGALLAEVRRSLPDAAVLVCLNETGLVGAMHPTFPMDPSTVVALLSRSVTALDEHHDAGRLLIGLHVPGHTDWATAIASGVSVLSVPATAGITGWADTLGDFLDRGGRIAWGAVPVDQPLGTSEELLWRRLSAVWCELVGEGLDPLVVRQRSLVSAVDGLGHFGTSQAERVLELVDSLSRRVGRQAIAARLSLGA